MPAQNVVAVPEEGKYIHIYNIGVEKRIIFNDQADYDVFINYLREYLSAPADPSTVKTSFTVNGKTFKGTPHMPKNYHKQVELIAYSLMPNHFHLLIHETSKSTLESFIRALCTRYSMYFNKKYSRSGSLLDGPYKSVQIPNMPSLLYLTRYIHKGSEHSSLSAYTSHNPEPWIHAGQVLEFYNRSKDNSYNELRSYQSFVEEADVEKQQNDILTGLTLETDSHILERSYPASYHTSAPSKQRTSNNGILLRLPEYSFLTMAFFALLAIGLKNIKVNESIAQGNTQTQVLGQTISEFPSQSTTPYQTQLLTPAPVVDPTTSPSSTPSLTPLPTPQPTAEPTLSPTPKAITGPAAVVKITDGSKSIHIRKEPNIYSEIISEATNNEMFEYVSTDLGWYQIRVETGMTGFISPKYSFLKQTN